MFTDSQVNKVIDELRKHNQYFVSEAHLQMSFILKAHDLFGTDFEFYPEFPFAHLGKRDEFDLLIVDKKSEERTVIEFKHKTKRTNKPLPVNGVSRIAFFPKSHYAQDLGRFDCWSDIERIEKLKLSGYMKNGFFIFLTNDNSYLTVSGHAASCGAFDISPGTYKPERKSWVKPVKISSIGKIRNRDIEIKQKYVIDYKLYLDAGCRNGKFFVLTLEI